VTTERVKPVFVFVAVTVTPGSAAPLVSTMRPVTEPELVCAKAAVVANRQAISASASARARIWGLAMISSY
jgi:hypothetical protein